MTEKSSSSLKVISNLPSVRVGKIINLFWTNGSYETPNKPISYEEIFDNFEEVVVKIDWINNDTGTIVLNGDFNYLIFNDGEYFFLEKSRVIDIQKKIYVYTCVRDLKQILLSYKTGVIVGTLVKTIHNETLNNYLDFTKPLIEDCDETIELPISEDLEKASVPKNKLLEISEENLKKAWVLNKKKLTKFLHKISRPNSKQILTQLRTQKGRIKLIISTELDPVTPHKTIIAKLNAFIKSDNLLLGTISAGEIAKVSPELNTKLTTYSKLMVLSKVNPTTESVQQKNIISFTVDNSKILSSDFFQNIVSIRPIKQQDLNTEFIHNKSIFDFDFSDDEKIIGGFDNMYELQPRAYTDISNFKNNNYAVVSPSLKYNISSQKMELVKHFNTSTSNTDKNNKSIFNNVSACYFPDFWNGKSWRHEAPLNNLGELRNISPSVGFILYEIANYWNITRDTSVTNRHYNMYTGLEPLRSLSIITGLRFYDPDDESVKINLIAEANEHYSTFKKTDKVVNLGQITAQQAKLPSNALYLANLYTFFKDPENLKSELETLSTEYAKNFGCSFTAAYYIDSSPVFGEIKYETTFDLTKAPINSQPSAVVGLTNLELFKACYKTYSKIREAMTLTKEIFLEDSILYGDYIWSNASWVFKDNINNQKLSITKPCLAMLFGPGKDTDHNYEFRFSSLTPIDPVPELARKNNVIIGDDSKQTLKSSDLYPWIIKEDQYNLSVKTKAVTNQNIITAQKNIRKQRSYELIKELVNDCINTTISVYGQHGSFSNQKLFQNIHYYSNQLKDIEKDNFLSRVEDECYEGITIERFDYYTGGWFRNTQSLVFIKSKKYGNDICVLAFNINTSGPNKALSIVKAHIKKLKEINEQSDQALGNINYVYSNDFYNSLGEMFCPKASEKNHFYSLFPSLRNDYFVNPATNQIFEGELSRNLASFYINKDLIQLIRTTSGEYKYSDINEDVLKGSNRDNKTWIFELNTKTHVSGYALIKWPSSETEPIIQILITDDFKIQPFKSEALSPKIEKLRTENIYRCINQQNFLYAWGQRFPLKSKLMRPNPSDMELQIFIDAINVSDPGFEKYRLKINTGLQVIDSKVVVPKRELKTGLTNLSYVELENLKLDIEDRKQKQYFDLYGRDEKHRIMNQNLKNSKEDLEWERYIQPVNIAASSVTGLAGAGMQAMYNPVGAVASLVSTGFNTVMEGIKHQHAMQVGQRGITQTDIANANAKYYEINTMNNRHKYEERKEKLKLLEVSNNVTQWTVNDADELQEFNKIMFKDENTNFGLIINLPSVDGILLNYITSFYERYGVDIFIPNYEFAFNNIEKEPLQIWQFDTIKEINIDDYKHREVISNIFLNGIKFIETEYLFEEAAHMKEAREEKQRLIALAKQRKEEMMRLEAEERVKISLEVAEIEKKIKEAEAEIERQKQHYQEQVDRLQNENSDLNTKVQTITVKLTESERLVTQKEGELTTSQAKLDECALHEEELSKTKTEKKTLEASVKQLNADKTKLTEELAEEKSAHTVASETVTAMIAAAQIHSEQMQALEKQIQTLNTQNTQKTAALRTATEKNNNLTRELNVCKTKASGCSEDEKLFWEIYANAHLLKYLNNVFFPIDIKDSAIDVIDFSFKKIKTVFNDYLEEVPKYRLLSNFKLLKTNVSYANAWRSGTFNSTNINFRSSDLIDNKKIFIWGDYVESNKKIPNNYIIAYRKIRENIDIIFNKGITTWPANIPNPF